MKPYNILILFFIQNVYGFDNSTNLCAGVKCVPKCCPIGQYVVPKKKCVNYDGLLDFSDVPVYQKDMTKSGRSASDLFVLDPGKFLNIEFKKFAFDLSSSVSFKLFLKEDGLLTYEFPNDYQRWKLVDQHHFCMDYGSSRNSTAITPRFWIVFDSGDEPAQSSWFLTGAMILSCVFLILVLVVYALLPELRNLCGLILMAYVASLLFSFLLLAVIQMRQHSRKTCKRLTFSTYFLLLASFCWMNVMSFDIWWTFRGYAKARPIHRRGEFFKFLMYCLYAFGLPLAMTLALVGLNEMDMTHWPWFVTPKIPLKGCFIEGGEKLLYLYMPMLILIVCNWIFFMMTAFNIWRLSRGTAVLDSAAAGTPVAHRTQMYRFSVYLKLSVVMGLNWVLEVVSFRYPNFKVWNITDLYNILIGLSIFLIFICKKKIYKKLKNLLGSFKRPGWYPSGNSRSSSTSDSNSSQETTLPICASPRGPTYIDKINMINRQEIEQLNIATK